MIRRMAAKPRPCRKRRRSRLPKPRSPIRINRRPRGSQPRSWMSAWSSNARCAPSPPHRQHHPQGTAAVAMPGPVQQQRRAAPPWGKPPQDQADPGPLQGLEGRGCGGQQPFQAAVATGGGNDAEHVQGRLAQDQGTRQLQGDHQHDQILPLRSGQVPAQWHQHRIGGILRMHLKPPVAPPFRDDALGGFSRLGNFLPLKCPTLSPRPLSQPLGEGCLARCPPMFPLAQSLGEGARG